LKAGSEYWLNLYLVLKEDTLWASAGHIVAMEQLAVPVVVPQAPELDISSLKDLSMTEDENGVKIEGDNFSIYIDRNSGVINSYKYNGKELFARGPVLNFWRAALNNDISIDSTWRVANRGMQVTAFKSALGNGGKTAVINIEFNLPMGKNSRATVDYIVYGNGFIKISSSLIPRGGMGELNRFGMDMLLPEGYTNIKYYGRGPVENYPDRNTGSFVGLYESTTDKEYFPYPYPQDTGNKTDVRWIALTKEGESLGILIKADGLMETSALHFNSEDLSSARHPYELVRRKETVLNINAKSRGVGNESCMGVRPLEQYLMRPTKKYSYSFNIIPFDTREDVLDLALINMHYIDISNNE